MIFIWGICIYTLTKLFKLISKELKVANSGYSLIKVDSGYGKFGT